MSQHGISEKELVLKALYAFYLPLALGTDGNTSSIDLTKSVIDSVWLLLNRSIEIHRSLDVRDPASIAVIDSFVKSIVPALQAEFNIDAVTSSEIPPFPTGEASPTASTAAEADTIFEDFEVNLKLIPWIAPMARLKKTQKLLLAIDFGLVVSKQSGAWATIENINRRSFYRPKLLRLMSRLPKRLNMATQKE